MNSNEYWQKRAEQNARRVYNYSQRQAQLVTRWFGRAREEMQRKINDYYRRYAAENEITYPAAKAFVNDRRALTIALEDIKTLSEAYPQDKVIQRYLSNDYLRRAVTREQLLLMQLDLLASQLYADYDKLTNESITKLFEESYYKSIFDTQQARGFGSAFQRLSVHQILAATQTAWKGKNYSQRLWGDHRNSLARYLNRIVTTGKAEGKSNAKMTAELRKAMDTGAYEARRLIRTESAQVCARANLMAYEENGTERFKFLAVLDVKTSEICRAMDGRIFLVSEGKIGVNINPLHPFCRSTTVPDIPDEEFDAEDTRAVRDFLGNTYKVPASMTYRDWYNKYIKGDPEELLAEQKYKNGAADAVQYKKYESVLGKDAPKSLDAYQEMKYIGGSDEPLRYMRLDCRRRRRLAARPELALPNAGAATAADAKFTGYLFGGEHQKGLAKGLAMQKRLGYSSENWQGLRDEILRKAGAYPAKLKELDEYGQRYEQKMVINGKRGLPANVIVGWIDKDNSTKMTSAYIKEADWDED